MSATASNACWAAHWGEYHDEVWGTRVTDPKVLFAQLSLCTQQCGVSWRIVWNKRHHYEAAFHNWDLARVASMSDADLDALCDKEGPWAGKLIQNRGKLSAIIHNARQCAAIDAATPGGLVRSLHAQQTAMAKGPSLPSPQAPHSCRPSMRPRGRQDRRFPLRRPVPRSPSSPRRVRYPTGQSRRLGCVHL